MRVHKPQIVRARDNTNNKPNTPTSFINQTDGPPRSGSSYAKTQSNKMQLLNKAAVDARQRQQKNMHSTRDAHAAARPRLENMCPNRAQNAQFGVRADLRRRAFCACAEAAGTGETFCVVRLSRFVRPEWANGLARLD